MVDDGPTFAGALYASRMRCQNRSFLGRSPDRSDPSVPDAGGSGTNVTEVETISENSFSVRSKGTAENKHQLTITINDISLKVQSTQGNLEPDMSQVIRKCFDMNLSPLGEESELKGAEEITYEMGPEGTRSIVSTFEQIFPDLAGRPLKMGDTWPDETTISEKTDNGKVVVQISEVNTLDGFETIII